MIEGSLGVKLPTMFDKWKAETGRARKKRRVEERRSEKRKSQKVGKPRNTVFFQWFVAPEGRKVGSLKRRARSHLAKWEMKNCTPLARSKFRSQNVQNASKRLSFGALLRVELLKKCTPLWREAPFEVKMYKTHQVRPTFGSWDVEKVHAVVARSTFPSPNVQNTPGWTTFGSWDVEKVHAVAARSTFASEKGKNTSRSDHFWKIKLLKKWTPLWREAPFEVKMYKTHQVRPTFGSWDVEKVHAVVARSTFPSPNVQNTPGWTTFGSWDVEKVHAVAARSTFASEKGKNTSRSDHFWKIKLLKKWTPLWREAHFEVKMYKTHEGFGPLLEIEMSKRCTPLWPAAHFEVKMWNAPGVRTTFGGSDVVSRGRRKGMCTLSKVRKCEGFVAFSTTSTITPHYTPIHYTTTTPSLHSTTLHSTTLH